MMLQTDFRVVLLQKMILTNFYKKILNDEDQNENFSTQNQTVFLPKIR